MKEVKITVGGREYVKRSFTVGDWLRMLDYTEEAGDKPISKEFAQARYRLLSDMFGVDEAALQNADLEETTRAFREIEQGVTKAFFGIAALPAEQPPAPAAPATD